MKCTVEGGHVKGTDKSLVMFRVGLGSKPEAWAWLTRAWAWLRLRPGLGREKCAPR